MAIESPSFIKSVEDILRSGEGFGSSGEFAFVDNCEGSKDVRYQTPLDLGIIDQLKMAAVLLSRENGTRSARLSVDMANSQNKSDADSARECRIRLEWVKEINPYNKLAIEISFGTENVSIRSDAYIDNDIVSKSFSITDLDLEELNREMLKAFRSPLNSIR